MIENGVKKNRKLVKRSRFVKGSLGVHFRPLVGLLGVCWRFAWGLSENYCGFVCRKSF